MRKTYKFRLYPTKAQEKTLFEILELCRWVYNDTLALRKNAWEESKKSLSLYDTNKILTQWKREHPELKCVYSQSLQNVQERVDLAFKAFFRRVKSGDKKVGYPRFKGKGRYDSITYKQFGFKLDGLYLNVAKIGSLKIKQHRVMQGTIKTLALHRTSMGKWFACFACDDVPETKLLLNEKAVGIDVGLESFATYSDGTKIENPRFFRKDEKDLAKKTV